jgi:hypothetical protein
MKMPAIMFSCAIEELGEAVDNKRPISSSLAGTISMRAAGENSKI